MFFCCIVRALKCRNWKADAVAIRLSVDAGITKDLTVANFSQTTVTI